ncbi:acyl-CoA/acyl-ACP dehydrogenase [bacterium]|nr:acyl-CoA/acyl-ACP dehydrogenase [bacterium]
MSFLVNQDLEEFSTSLKEFFDAEAPLEKVRALNPQAWTDWQAKLWAKIAELGVFAAAAREEHQGLGLGQCAVDVISRLSAAALLPIPLAETLLFGIQAISTFANHTTQSAYLENIINGNLRVTGSFTKSNLKLTDASVSGELEVVPALAWASKVIFLAQAENQAFKLCALDNTNLDTDYTSGLDLIRPYCTILLKSTPVTILSDDLSAKDLELYTQLVNTTLASELVGCGVKALELTTEYVKTREQFGKPIGSFQAVQHKISDMYLAVEACGTLTRFSSWCFDNDQVQFAKVSAAAKALTSENMPAVLEKSIQTHGGMGFTHEYPLHLYLRRAVVNSKLGNTYSDLYSLVASQSLATTSSPDS